MNPDWLEPYLAEVGRELDLGSTQLHETTNWALGVAIAAVTGLAVAGHRFPMPGTLMVVVVADVLLVRFFVRSCLAYANLHKWNRINRLAVRHMTEDNEASTTLQVLREAVDRYHLKWESPEPWWKIVKSNLKLAYGQLFAVMGGLTVYGFCLVDWDARVVGLLVLLVADLVWEALVFPRKTYLKYAGPIPGDPFAPELIPGPPGAGAQG